jgi:hypothetical protein
MDEIIFLSRKRQKADCPPVTLGESIHTQADSVEELHARIRDAVRCHFEDGKAPKMICLHFVRNEIIAG